MKNDHQGPGAAMVVPRVVGILGSVVGPATLLGALMFFFGRQHAAAYFGHFGVSQSVFNFTTTDYLFLSHDGLFVPLVVMAFGILLTVWAHRLLRYRVSARFRRISRVVALVLGGIGFLVAIAGIWWPLAFADMFLLPGLSLVAAVLLVRYAAPSARSSSTNGEIPIDVIVEWSAVFILVGIGLFWAVANYSQSVGTERARQLEASLRARSEVVAHSSKPLNLPPAVTTVITCADGSGYRYPGMRLVVQAGDHYLLVPADWRHGRKPAVLLPRSGDLRLEFTSQPTRIPPGTPDADLCPGP